MGKNLMAYFLLCAVVFAEEKREKAIVIVDVLKVRSTPDLKGEVVAKLTKGEIVKVVEESKNRVEIDDITESWLKVTIQDKAGWVFGGYADRYYHEIKGHPGMVSWSVNRREKPGKPAEIKKISLYNLKTKKEAVVVASMEDGEPAYSENLLYLALDGGTDVVGTISIYEVASGKLLRSDMYIPREFHWQGSTLQYWKVICTDDGLSITSEEIFKDGKIISTGKYRRWQYHAGENAGGCKPYMHLLKKSS